MGNFHYVGCKNVPKEFERAASRILRGQIPPKACDHSEIHLKYFKMQSYSFKA